MEFREYSLMGDVMCQVRLLQQGLSEHKLPYECVVKETSHRSLTIEFIRNGQQTASFKRAFPFVMAISWLESVICQLGRIPLLLAAEEEYLALAVKRCRKLYHNGMVDKSEYMTASRLANQVFGNDDMPLNSCSNSHAVINLHELITVREAANSVEVILGNQIVTEYPAM